MKVKETTALDLSVTSSTKGVELNGRGPVSIQPVVSKLVGVPTYTLEVSNDNQNFVEYDRLSTNLELSKAIQINYDEVPWWYVRITVTTPGGTSGRAHFQIYQGIKRYADG